MDETQATINAWQRERFPAATEAGVANHLAEEFQELLAATTLEEKIEESADLIILSCCMAMLKGVDLQPLMDILPAQLSAAVDRKMAKNRARQWNIQPDGTGRHT